MLGCETYSSIRWEISFGEGVNHEEVGAVRADILRDGCGASAVAEHTYWFKPGHLASGQPVSRLSFTRSLLQHLDALYLEYLDQGLAPVQKAWTELCDMVGQQVRVDCQSQVIQGRVEGLGDDGALLVAMDDGRVERVLAGDVTLA